MTQEITLQGIVTEIYTEDVNNAKSVIITLDEEKENGLYVRIVSWDMTHEHTDFNRLIHIMDKVTVEISSRALKAGEPSGLLDGDKDDN
jgi:ABC-type Mn2+/Zn2+ transport system ATPase subunit